MKQKKFITFSLLICFFVLVVICNFLFISKVEARCNTACQAQRRANAMWSNFMSNNPGGGTSMGNPQPFGGRVSFIFPCTCEDRKSAFFIMPVAGTAGPYTVQEFYPYFKSYGSLLMGANVLGVSDSGGSCSFRPIPYPGCFTFQVQQTVTAEPGMGISH